jgi:hypothetical protein
MVWEEIIQHLLLGLRFWSGTDTISTCETVAPCIFWDCYSQLSDANINRKKKKNTRIELNKHFEQVGIIRVLPTAPFAELP